MGWLGCYILGPSLVRGGNFFAFFGFLGLVDVLLLWVIYVIYYHGLGLDYRMFFGY